MSDSLQSVITETMKQMELPVEEAGVPVPESTQDSAQESTSNEEKASEPANSLSEAERLDAFRLFEALKDPNKSRTVIEFLAQQAGFVQPPAPAAKTEEAPVEQKPLNVLLAEHLGKDLDFLAPALSGALEQYFNQKLNAAVSPLYQQSYNAQARQVQNESQLAVDNLSKTHYEGKGIPSNIEAEMSKIMNDYKPSNTTSPKDYIENVYHMAIGRLGISSRPPVDPNRVLKNRNDAPSRLASSGIKAQDRGMSIPQTDNKAKSLREIIAGELEAAMAN